MGDGLGGHLGHVLIVDDNEANREVLSRRLERHGYSFAAAEDGIQAMEMMRSQPFDIVMLDIMMPRMNGYQVLEAMKADPALSDLPVIVVSAVSELESIVRCVELGAEDYLFKPFNPVLLKARLTAILEKNRRLAALKESTQRAKVAIQSSLQNIKEATTALLDTENAALTEDQRELVQHIAQTTQNLTTQLPRMIP